MTKFILVFGLSVLVGSFAYFGDDLNMQTEVASFSSRDEQSDLNKYQRCYKEICGKSVEDFVKPDPDYTGLIDEELESELVSFVAAFEENEIELQRLVKKRTEDILSGDLSGDLNFGLFDPKDIFVYSETILSSFDGVGGFEDYLQGAFKKKSSDFFKSLPKMKKWADEEVLFPELIQAQKLYNRSDLEAYSKELYPDVDDYKERLRLLSLKIVESTKDLNWMLGLDMKNKTWPAEMFLETGFLDEMNFMDELKNLDHIKMIEIFVKKKIETKEFREVFETFTRHSGYRLIYDEATIYDAFMGMESYCREAMNDELYWASSDLRNRSIESHFLKLKETSKEMFSFSGDEDVKKAFDEKIDRLELVKQKSVQQTKAFYPFYFKKLLESQRRSIEILKSDDFRSVSLFLNSYFTLLQDFNSTGETREARSIDDYHYVKSLTLFNEACGSYDGLASIQGSSFSPSSHHLYLEMKRVRSFSDGIVVLAHEIAHGISTIIKRDKVFDFISLVKSDAWDKRACVDQYYLDEYRKDPSQEGRQTEEDWADYFASALVKKIKTQKDYSWASEHFECEFVKPHELESETADVLKPHKEGFFIGSHSSNLFRMMAFDLYSKGELGPACKGLAEEETGLLKSCESK